MCWRCRSPAASDEQELANFSFLVFSRPMSHCSPRAFLLRERQKYILYPEESNTAEGRGHGASIITACGVKWRRHDSFGMKAEVGQVGSAAACVAALITHITLPHSSVIASHFPFFLQRRHNCVRRRETFLSMFDEEPQSTRVSVFFFSPCFCSAHNQTLDLASYCVYSK